MEPFLLVIVKKVHMVISRTQDDFKRETGIETSLTDTDAKEYLLQVLEEIENKRKFLGP